MHTLFPRKRLILLYSALVVLASCVKKEATEPDKDPNAAPDKINVVRDGASFSQNYTLMHNVVAGTTIGVEDFAINPENQVLRILCSVVMPSQQGPFTTYICPSVSLVTGQESIYDGYGDGTDYQYWGFMPYSRKLVAFESAPYAPGFYIGAAWEGDGIAKTQVPAEPSSVGYNCTGGLGYRDGYADFNWKKHYMCLNPDFNATGMAPVSIISKEYLSPADVGPETRARFPEPRSGNGALPVIITIGMDKAVAYKFTYIDSATNTPGVYTKTGELAVSGYDLGINYQTQRHYSADGNKLAMLVRDDNNQHCWTYTYDHTTETLTAVVANAALPYSGEGSDIDMDDDGNIYYTGVSGNGNGAGVSVYKRTPSGATVVGTDDFLKFGTVSKLHYLNGKVHMVITGSVSGTPFWKQVCYLVQQ